MNPDQDPSEPGGELALPEASAVKTMVESVLRQQPRTAKLGMSTRRLRELVRAHRLSENQLEVLLSVRSDFDGGISQALKLFQQGLTMDGVYLVYGTREAVRLNFGDFAGRPVPLQTLALLVQAFHLEDIEPEDLAETIHVAYCRWVDEEDSFLSPTEVVQLLLEVGASHEGISLEAAFHALQQSVPEKEHFGREDA